MRLKDIKIGGWYKVVDAFGGTQKAEVIELLPGDRASVSVRYERRKNAVPKRPDEIVEPWGKEEARQAKVRAHREGRATKPTPGIKDDIKTILAYLSCGYVSNKVRESMTRLGKYAR